MLKKYHNIKFTKGTNVYLVLVAVWFSYFNCNSFLSFFYYLLIFSIVTFGIYSTIFYFKEKSYSLHAGFFNQKFQHRKIKTNKNIANYSKLSDIKHGNSKNKMLLISKYKYLYFFIPLIFYISFAIASFPPFHNLDEDYQIAMGSNGHPWKTYKTIFTTLIYKLFSINGSHWEIYIFFICIFLAYAVYYTVTNSQNMFSLKNKTCFFLTLFFSFNLVYSRSVFYIVNDVPLSISVMILLVFIYKTFIYEKSFKLNKVIKFTLLLFLINNLRPNVIVSIVFLFGFLYFSKFYKQYKKQILFSAGLFFIITIIFQSIIFFVLHPIKVPDKEYLSLPIQAVAKTYIDNGNISPKANFYFTKIQPIDEWKKNYSYDFVDSEKGDMGCIGNGLQSRETNKRICANFNKVKKEEFMKYYLTGVLPHNITSTLHAVKGMWSNYFQIKKFTGLGSAYVQYTKNKFISNNIKVVLNIYHIIRSIISIWASTLFLLILLPFFRGRKLLILIFPILYTVTGLFFTPAYILRYAFPVIFSIPFLLIVAISKTYNFKNSNNRVNGS